MRRWEAMNKAVRRAVADLTAADIPTAPGVYALYREDEAVYVGKANSLRLRLWANHLRRGASMRNSAMRRNVAAHLGIASAADIKARRYLPSREDAARVSGWIAACELAWIECASPADAVTLETELKLEAKPPLTQR